VRIRRRSGGWLATKYAKGKFGLAGITSGLRPGKLFGRAPVTGLVDMASEIRNPGIKHTESGSGDETAKV
jgi:hypothetical protein